MSIPTKDRRRTALFSLKPLNDRAKEVIRHPSNRHLISQWVDGTNVLDIGFHIRSRFNSTTIATLGRGIDADIIVEGKSIAKIQCSFEFEPTTNVIMLLDRSHGQTTHVFGDTATPFEYGRSRQLVIQKDLNTMLGLGGRAQSLVDFEILWHHDPTETTQIIKARETLTRDSDYDENPRLARTVDEAETTLPSCRQTRIHTPGSPSLKMRYIKVSALGSGQFGVVYKAVNIDTGKFIAVKVLRRPHQDTKDEHLKSSWYYALKREVEILSHINHPYIIEYVTSQGWEGPCAEIFMGLKDGNLRSLVRAGKFPSVRLLAECVLYQMLQALDYLAANGIVHRDVKPENILYTSLPGEQYLFQLGDFGLCNRTVSAETYVGSPLYMAPEIIGHGAQTNKMDVWSLFVTVAWTLDIDGFRQRSEHLKSIKDTHQAILAMASKVEIIQEMSRVDPYERASAAQMLVKCFQGNGLTTKESEVPAINLPRLNTLSTKGLSNRSPWNHPSIGKEFRGQRRGHECRVQKSYGFRLRHEEKDEEVRPQGKALHVKKDAPRGLVPRVHLRERLR